MKLQVLSGLALARLSAANFSNMLNLIAQLEELSYNKSVEAGTMREDDRGFVGLIESKLTDLDHYGCWCYFDEDYRKAKGPVQDGLDAECKKLINGYSCIELDALAGGYTCDVLNQPYTTYNLFGANPDVIGDCTTNDNVDPNKTPVDQQECAVNLCIVEGTFTLTLYAQLLQAAGIKGAPGFDASLAHPVNTVDNGNPGPFDPDQECNTNHLYGAGRSEKECCGEYPARYPFKTFDGDRACCGQRTYNTQTLRCCADITEEPSNALLDTVQDINNACPSANGPELTQVEFDDLVNDGWTIAADNFGAYKLFSGQSAMTWAQAVAFCESQGDAFTIASTTTFEEWKTQQQLALAEESTWMGLNHKTTHSGSQDGWTWDGAHDAAQPAICEGQAGDVCGDQQLLSPHAGRYQDRFTGINAVGPWGKAWGNLMPTSDGGNCGCLYFGYDWRNADCASTKTAVMCQGRRAI